VISGEAGTNRPFKRKKGGVWERENNLTRGGESGGSDVEVFVVSRKCLVNQREKQKPEGKRRRKRGLHKGGGNGLGGAIQLFTIGEERTPRGGKSK